MILGGKVRLKAEKKMMYFFMQNNHLLDATSISQCWWLPFMPVSNKNNIIHMPLIKPLHGIDRYGHADQEGIFWVMLCKWVVYHYLALMSNSKQSLLRTAAMMEEYKQVGSWLFTVPLDDLWGPVNAKNETSRDSPFGCHGWEVFV